MSALRRWFGPYATARVWKETSHLLADLAVGIALFTWVVTLLSLSGGLAITLLGLPLLAFTVASGRWIAATEKARVRSLLGVSLAPWPTLHATGTVWQRMVRRFSDAAGWKGLLYGVVLLPWGIASFTVAVTLWSVAWSLAAFPMYGWWLPTGSSDGFHPEGWAKVGLVLGSGVVGVVLVAVLPRVIHGMATAGASIARALLAPDEAALLQQRVEELTERRDASTESAAQELRRIERDLHDGAQQRLVSVAMKLGMVKDSMAKDRVEQIEDPRARELVSQAHDEAKQAIVELRELVRGIHPAVLTDRGLDAAVSALVARCPVAVSVHSDLPRRLPPTVEGTAYFVVAEALTNIAKHSGARQGSVRMTDRGDTLVVEVHDDGVGGAQATGLGGLHGLVDRVRSVDGTLRIASPAGGPTTLIAEIPCGS
jgi:signal transduction histidine kinase